MSWNQWICSGKLAANEKDIIDEVWLPLINERKVSADVLCSSELNANNEAVDNIDSTSNRSQVPVTLKVEVLRLAGLGESSHLEETDSANVLVSKKFTESY